MGTGSSRPVSVAASSTAGARRHAGRRTSAALGIQVTGPHEKRLQALHTAMHTASAQADFEKAAKLRDQISLLHRLPVDGPGPEADFNPSGLVRQRPGPVGLGTSRQDVKPPSRWKPPKRPEPMTKGRGRGRQKGDRSASDPGNRHLMSCFQERPRAWLSFYLDTPRGPSVAGVCPTAGHRYVQ